jgi:hypothetical protein
VAVIGQAFPYTPIANPRHFVPDWTFGIQEVRLQATIEAARAAGAKVVVLLSHNGMDVDLKLAARVRGLAAILGGHTHDAVPTAIEVAKNVSDIANEPSDSVGHAEMKAPVVQPPPIMAPAVMIVIMAVVFASAGTSSTFGAGCIAASFDGIDSSFATKPPGSTPTMRAARQRMSSLITGTAEKGTPIRLDDQPTKARTAPEKPRYPPCIVAARMMRPPTTPPPTPPHEAS